MLIYYAAVAAITSLIALYAASHDAAIATLSLLDFAISRFSLPVVAAADALCRLISLSLPPFFFFCFSRHAMLFRLLFR